MVKRSGGFISNSESLPWIAVLIGAVSLLYYFSNRRRRPGQGAPGAAPGGGAVTSSIAKNANLRTLLAEQKHHGWKVAVCSEVFGAGNESNASLVKSLAEKCEMFIFARVSTLR